MNRKLRCIMLVDDNADDNFFHERIIKRSNAAEVVIVMQSADEALAFLSARSEHPDLHPELIFLDINMPGMNGWEFLDEYSKLDEQCKSQVVIVMLTTSVNPDDESKAKALNMATDFKIKPLTKEMLQEIIELFFP
jgi:CheY-like chemotaxis protein